MGGLERGWQFSVRTELVEVPAMRAGFDRLSPNGVG